MEPIAGFFGSYRWLSNFWPAPVVYEGVQFPTVEHAYQAAKTKDEKRWREFQLAKTPGDAKRLGRTLVIRKDWERVKVGVMLELLRFKFGAHAELATKLLATKDAELIEANNWGDTFWGVWRGKGHNQLGKLLMQVREELKAATRPG
jgi:ribA/ribD-fused uncharacterized protein